MIYNLTYLSDGLKVKGYLSLPYGFGLPASELAAWLDRYHQTNGLPVIQAASPIHSKGLDVRNAKWPALLYCRGGIGHVGRVQTHWLEKFSRRGYVTFAPSYRGSESGEGRDEFGGRDLEDVLSAYRMLSHMPFVDEGRISALGFSRGAINAAQAATRLNGLHKLVVWGGVSDLARTYEERPDLRRMLKRVVGGSPARNPEAYAARSPIRWAENIKCPVLVIHATEDVQVDCSHGLSLYQKLRLAGKKTEFHRYEGYGHHLPPDVHEEAITRMFRWIAEPCQAVTH